VPSPHPPEHSYHHTHSLVAEGRAHAPRFLLVTAARIIVLSGAGLSLVAGLSSHSSLQIFAPNKTIYCPPNHQHVASKEHILPDLQIQNCFISRSIMPRNIIDDWWAQGKDEHVTGKRSRKQKKFDDDNPQRNGPTSSLTPRSRNPNLQLLRRRRKSPLSTKPRRSQAKPTNPAPPKPTPIWRHLLCLLCPIFRPWKTAIPVILLYALWGNR